MSKSVVSLDCGCLFQGRDFYINPICEEHGEFEETDNDMCTCITWVDSKPVSSPWLKIIKLTEITRIGTQ